MLAVVIVLAGVSLGVAVFLKVHQQVSPAAHVAKLPGNVDMSLQKIHFTETRDGVKKWDLVADRTDYDKGREIAFLAGIRLVVTGGRSTGDIALTADKADYHMKTRDVFLYGKVRAHTASGMAFTTERARFDASREVITSPGEVKFSDRRMEVEGTGMEFFTKTHDLHLSRAVTASVRGREVGR